MKLVITGKNGLLSRELQKLDPNIIGLDKEYFDITDKTIQVKLKNIGPDVIIHAAAITDSHKSRNRRIQVVSRDILKTQQPDYILILTHNFADYVVECLRSEYKGKYIILIPEIKII